MLSWKSALFGMAGLAASALPAAAQQSGAMTLMSYAGIFRENYTDVVVRPFQAGGAPVQYAEGGTSAQMLGMLRAQKADPQIDVVIMDVTTAALACAEGLVEKMPAASWPILGQLDPQARAAGGECGPGVMFDHMVMVYDSQAVKPAPTRFSAMADAAQRGAVGFAAPPNIQGLAVTAILAHAAAQDWRNIGAALPALKAIAANTQSFDPKPDGYTMILNGQLRFATGWNARAQLYRDQSQGRIGVVLPDEGTIFQINTINIVANAKNRERAVAFTNHALSAAAQKAFTERMFYGPTNTTAQVSPEAMQRTALAPEFRSRVIPLDWEEMLKLRDTWNQRWRREVISAAPR
ncbi:ABC transporter substrate-binding protein [Pseudoroseomonas deserti]|uniref:ABC transporter substrate-binding protein n=1 Tax=Teichococcus deserti TaxID=1817963 RepID=A0A1V2GUK8_9PROT|nr:extracellular solute-binding protein [Pseudoroseomonas deserti]ONG44631.1 ABC transporter substrate-binding protein [Pseudoroseomonas deserti]